MAAAGLSGGVLARTYDAGARLAERRARPHHAPAGRRALSWVPAALLVVLAVAGALVVLRAGVAPATDVPGPAPGPAGYGDPAAPAAATGSSSWNLTDLVAVLLPWAVPLVIGGAGLADGRFADRRGAVAGILLVGLTGATVTSLLDLLVDSGADTTSGAGRWLGVLYLLRFGFAVQVLVAVVLWAHLAPPRHKVPLAAAFAATLGAALPLLFGLVGDDLLLPLWHDGAWVATALPVAALLLLLVLLPGGHTLVAPGQGWGRTHRAPFVAVALLGAVGLAVALATLLLADDRPAVLGLWPVVALAGCLVAAGLAGRTGGIASVAGALLAMAVGLAAFPAALFAWDRSAVNPGLGLDTPGEAVPWIAGLVVAGVAGAALGRGLGSYAVGLAAVGLVLAEVIGPDSGQAHVLAVRCAGAAALGVVVGALRPEAAIAALGLDAACGPVWPELQAVENEYEWVGVLTEKPGGIPVPLLVFAVLAVLLGTVAGLRGRQAHLAAGTFGGPGGAGGPGGPGGPGGAGVWDAAGPAGPAPWGAEEAPGAPAAPGSGSGAYVPPQAGAPGTVPGTPPGPPPWADGPGAPAGPGAAGSPGPGAYGAAGGPGSAQGGPADGPAPGFGAGFGPGARAGDLRGEDPASPGPDGGPRG